MESNYRYYARRASEEARAASRAVTAEARARHQELARLFEAKAQRPVPLSSMQASMETMTHA